MSRPATRVDSSGVTHKVFVLYNDDKSEVLVSDECRPGWKVLHVEELHRGRNVDCMGCLVESR